MKHMSNISWYLSLGTNAEVYPIWGAHASATMTYFSFISTSLGSTDIVLVVGSIFVWEFVELVPQKPNRLENFFRHKLVPTSSRAILAQPIQ